MERELEEASTCREDLAQPAIRPAEASEGTDASLPWLWGSFERNTGMWCPYNESEQIENAFIRGDRSVSLPQCFNATVVFAQPHCYQRTPAIGDMNAACRLPVLEQSEFRRRRAPGGTPDLVP